MNIRHASEFKFGEPGLYRDVPDSTYHAFNACSNSRLSLLKQSPAKLKHAIDNPDDTETPAKIFGRAAHAAILEPMQFAQKFDKARQCHGETKGGDRCSYNGKERHGGKWYCGRHAPEGEPQNVTALSEDDYDAVLGMRKAVDAHRAASHILSFGGGSELSALWIHEETGQLCKMRIDFYAPDVGILVDYKTSRDLESQFGVTWEFFQSDLACLESKALYNYGYHRQGAFYLLGMRALGLNLKDFVVLAQEKDAPFQVVAMRIRDDALKAGKSELDRLISLYAECEREDTWPAFPDGKIIDVTLPEWAFKRIYDTEVMA